jgi:hypothetical protein
MLPQRSSTWRTEANYSGDEAALHAFEKSAGKLGVVFDFELSSDEIATIDALDTGRRGGPGPDSITLESHGREIPEARAAHGVQDNRFGRLSRGAAPAVSGWWSSPAVLLDSATTIR